MKAKAVLKQTAKMVLPYGVVLVSKKLYSRTLESKSALKLKREISRDFSRILLMAKSLDNKSNPTVIVSLTTYGRRIKETAPRAIASILAGTVLPDKIILWLAYGEKISPELKKLVKLGVEIGFTEDTYSYKKLLPTLKKYPDATIITVDDDVTYPDTWLEKTLSVHKENPDAVVANRAREITVRGGKMTDYWSWPVLTKNGKNHHTIFPTGVGGVLYPPHSLHKEVFNKDLFTSISPRGGDDAWFWTMTELAGTRRVLVEDGFREVESFELDKTTGLSVTALVSNNERLKRIFEHFPKIKKNISISL